MAYIVNAVSAYPENVYHQNEIKNFLKNVWKEQSDFVEQFCDSTKVETRNLTLPLNHYLDLGGSENRNKIWKSEAVRLQKINISNILNLSKIDILDIGLLISATTTGITVPSLDALMMNHFAFSPNTKRIPLFGLGCLAGVAGINRANDYLKAYPKKAALFLVTELCSLTYQMKDQRTANIIGTSLFGDGSGAVLLVGDEHPLATKSQFEIIASESTFYPNTEHLMGWNIIDSGFQIVLSGEIPNLVKDQVGKNIYNFLNQNLDQSKKISFYIAHPGGPKVLDALCESLDLPKDHLALSWKSLKEHGNTSATSVINVLEQTIKEVDINPNSMGLMMAMGPAFCLELGVLRKC